MIISKDRRHTPVLLVVTVAFTVLAGAAGGAYADNVEYACIREYSFTPPPEQLYTEQCTPYDPSGDHPRTCTYTINTNAHSEYRRVLGRSNYNGRAACFSTALMASLVQPDGHGGIAPKPDGFGGVLPNYDPDFVLSMPAEIRPIFQFVWHIGCWKRASPTAPWEALPEAECDYTRPLVETR